MQAVCTCGHVHTAQFPAEVRPTEVNHFMDMAHRTDRGIDPLVRGTLVSFGFVFAHPFMDGNGRLSRFLFHKVVCGHGQLPNGLVLPVSVAMKRHEAHQTANRLPSA
ncbi:MAG: hypothetical protein CO065_04580 [Comamonadaceae bacterium CG_4_9_14_0_8_um_filter_57_21]|nr:hypothetical protein [Rhodoferax sp.]NCS60042.1 hypothetical protein [Rhodoferax sp.]PJC20888.1 MAG: hypothetical protein CO065_04580 [Comamonadaceae bacterium CG_4_9_14_0_8_um_filter_57_21]